MRRPAGRMSFREWLRRWLILFYGTGCGLLMGALEHFDAPLWSIVPAWLLVWLVGAFVHDWLGVGE